jgi:hypothetical protein
VTGRRLDTQMDAPASITLLHMHSIQACAIHHVAEDGVTWRSVVVGMCINISKVRQRPTNNDAVAKQTQ